MPLRRDPARPVWVERPQGMSTGTHAPVAARWLDGGMTQNATACTTAGTTGTARDRRAFVAPLVTTLITLPLGLVTLFFAGISPMACDSCNGEEAHRFDDSFAAAFTVFQVGLAVALALLVTAWVLPWQRRHAAKRVVLAALAPSAVVLAWVLFFGMVDWP